MKRLGCLFLAFALAGTSFSISAQQTAEVVPVNAQGTSAAATVAPVINPAFPQPPEIAGKAYLLLDVNSGQILAQNNVDMPVEPASITKLMTAYLVFDALRANRLKLDQALLVSARARNMEGSRMFVEQGAQVTVDDLIKGMIVQSGNDATIVLAEGVGGSVENFVSMMNQQTHLLGMRSTTFKNPEGLPDAGHLTTARDLATLASCLMTDFPEEYKYYAIKEFTYPPPGDNVKSITQPNRNRLLNLDPSVDGLKTGHTSSAGYCLVASAAREFPNLNSKRRLLSIVLGTESDKIRTEESQKLLNWGFVAWDDVQLFAPNMPIVTPEVWKGSENQAKLGSTTAVVVSVPRGMVANVMPVASYTDPLIAPIMQGQEAGELNVTLDTPTGPVALVSRKLVALEAVDEAGFLGRMWDGFRLWIR